MGGRPLGHLKKQEIMIIFLCTLSILSSYLTACRFSIIYFCMSLRFSSSQQTCISISCSCRSISFVADPSILCSSIREKCSMLLIDSFSCRVRITSFQTEEHHCYSCSTPPTRDIVTWDYGSCSPLLITNYMMKIVISNLLDYSF